MKAIINAVITIALLWFEYHLLMLNDLGDFGARNGVMFLVGIIALSSAVMFFVALEEYQS
jgi:hypothetical membrane protein